MKTQPASEYALLGALVRGPRHGYEIRSFLREGLGATWHIPTSQLYAQLKRLEERGYVASSLESQAARPAKRVFELTHDGRNVFLAWVHAPVRHIRDLRVEFLAKLFFIRKLGLEGSRLVQDQDEVLANALEHMKDRMDREKDPHRRLSTGFKHSTAKAWRRWLQDEARPFVEERIET